MGAHPLHPMLTLSAPDELASPAPLLLVDGHNLLWGATFGFPAPIYSRDKTRLLTGVFAFFALLRVAIRDDVPGGAPEVIVVFDGEHGSEARKQTHDGYKASRPVDDQALAPLRFLTDVKRGLDNRGIAWIELEDAEADDVIATLVAATPEPREVIILSRDRDWQLRLLVLGELTPSTVRDLLTKLRPEVVITHNPDDIHPDHERTAQTLLAAPPEIVIATGHPRRVYTCDGYHNLRRDGHPLHLPVIVDVTSVWDTSVMAG